MVALKSNGITLEVERRGDPLGPPVLLIRGLGSQLIHWPEQMIAALMTAGFHVVTFDNRDSGLSQKCGDRAPYSLRDIADDAVGLMDALGIARAHVLGLSMGGMILQLIALHHPDRLSSATIVMSSSQSPRLPQADPEIQEMMRATALSPQRADVIAHELWTGRGFQSPRWPFDDTKRAALIGRAFDRCYCPQGTARQYAAVTGASEHLADIEAIRTPTLVIHGTEDRLLPPAHGRNIAARIPGAELIEIDGMGHDLEGDLPLLIAQHFEAHIKKSAAWIPRP